MDFAGKPGLLFVVATLLPLASFVLVLVYFGVRAAVRSSPEGTLGASLYQAMGGGHPLRWPAWSATLAIGLALGCSLIGFVMYTTEAAKIEHLKEEVAEKREKHAKMRHGPVNEKPADAAERTAKRKELGEEIEDEHAKIEEMEGHWTGQVTWLRLGGPYESRQGTALKLGFKIDHLSGIMFVMVTLIATLIHLFSMGYMAEERQSIVEDHQVHSEDGHYKRMGRYGRFFLFLSLFCFSMLNLVLADNLFQVFISWELVGLCSYLLIGFYFERQTASNAANKAFITNRIGDAGFIIGLLVLWTFVGTFNFDELFRRVRSPQYDSHGEVMPMTGQIVRGQPMESDGVKQFQLSPAGDTVLLFPKNVQLQFTKYKEEQARREGREPEAEAHLHGHDLTPNGVVPEVKHDPGPDDFSTMPYWMLVVAGLGIFLGCVGKSAQFPLHVWLPDAMEGPTPVSALIHAATMVAAGVYLVGRCFPLFTSEALLVIAYTGGITLFVAATIAVVMRDIKKVLAYSTVSQLGYMMLALGVGGWVAGLFHLLTHAFFKALLFLGSGSVIVGCHHEQDLYKMGGLYPRMKITALTMLMGVLAIAGTPAFSGWYSKDAIVASALGYVKVHPEHILLFLLPLATAALTTFYMFRMWFLAFTGKPRDPHVYEHAHESPRIMTGPLVVLAVFAVCVAWGWPHFAARFPFFNAQASWLEHQLHHAQPLAVQADFGSEGVAGGENWAGPYKPAEQNERLQALDNHHLAGDLAMGAMAIGLVFAFVVYYYRVLDPVEGAAQFPGVTRFLAHKWYFDELYSAVLVRPALTVSWWCRTLDLKAIDWLIDNLGRGTTRVARGEGVFDNRVIDGLVNLTASISYGIGGWFRRWQTGYLRSYVLFLVMAAVGIFVILSYFVAV
jgi:NADH-quinone oxidoreductase subunit L